MSVNNAAASIGISRRELYRRMAAGDIEWVPLGRRRFIPTDAIDTYIARLRREAKRTRTRKAVA